MPFNQFIQHFQPNQSQPLKCFDSEKVALHFGHISIAIGVRWQNFARLMACMYHMGAYFGPTLKPFEHGGWVEAGLGSA